MFLLIIDLEATCFGGEWETGLQEVIEFPAILIEKESYNEISTFHHYVRPTQQPVLSDFCKHLTGISQETINASLEFTKVLDHFQDWTRANGLHPGNCTLVTFGSWDMKQAIPNACAAANREIPAILDITITKHANLKKICQKKTGILPASIPHLMNIVGQKFEGKEQF